MTTEKEILSDITVHMKYARYQEELQRRETWAEIVKEIWICTLRNIQI